MINYFLIRVAVARVIFFLLYTECAQVEVKISKTKKKKKKKKKKKLYQKRTRKPRNKRYGHTERDCWNERQDGDGEVQWTESNEMKEEVMDVNWTNVVLNNHQTNSTHTKPLSDRWRRLWTMIPQTLPHPTPTSPPPEFDYYEGQPQDRLKQSFC